MFGLMLEKYFYEFQYIIVNSNAQMKKEEFIVLGVKSLLNFHNWNPNIFNVNNLFFSFDFWWIYLVTWIFLW